MRSSPLSVRASKFLTKIPNALDGSISIFSFNSSPKPTTEASCPLLVTIRIRTFGVGAVFVTMFVPDGRNGTLQCLHCYKHTYSDKETIQAAEWVKNSVLAFSSTPAHFLLCNSFLIKKIIVWKHKIDFIWLINYTVFTIVIHIVHGVITHFIRLFNGADLQVHIIYRRMRNDVIIPGDSKKRFVKCFSLMFAGTDIYVHMCTLMFC